MAAQSSSSRTQFALTPTPLSYAVPPGANVAEGLLRSLAGFWPEWPTTVTPPNVRGYEQMKTHADGKLANNNGYQESLKRKAPSTAKDQESLKRQASSLGKEPVSPRKASSTGKEQVSVKKTSKEQAMASSNKLEINQPAPEGFRVVIQIRKNGKTAGHRDKYYIDEKGRKFRSKMEINRYMMAMQQNATTDAAPVATSGSSGVTETSKAPEGNGDAVEPAA